MLLSEFSKRLYGKLYQDLGPVIISALDDKNIHEIIITQNTKYGVSVYRNAV